MHDVSGRRLGMEDTWLDYCHVSMDASCLMFEWRNMGREEVKGKEFFLWCGISIGGEQKDRRDKEK